MAQYIYTMNRVAKVIPPKRYLIRDISLSFYPGAKIGVLGLNGCGKSTLGRAILRLHEPTSGPVLLEGKDFTALGREALIADRRRMQITNARVAHDRLVVQPQKMTGDGHA